MKKRRLHKFDEMVTESVGDDVDEICESGIRNPEVCPRCGEKFTYGFATEGMQQHFGLEEIHGFDDSGYPVDCPECIPEVGDRDLDLNKYLEWLHWNTGFGFSGSGKVRKHLPGNESRDVYRRNQRIARRFAELAVGARYAASAFSLISTVEKVALFGPVARGPQEKKQTRKLEAANVFAFCEPPSEVELALWLTDLSGLEKLKSVLFDCLIKLRSEQNVGMDRNQFNIHILEPSSNLYRGILCKYAMCPAQKPACLVSGCGLSPFLQQQRNFRWNPSVLFHSRCLYTRLSTPKQS